MRRGLLEVLQIFQNTPQIEHHDFLFAQDLRIKKASATCFESAKELEEELNAQADSASRLAAANDEADKAAHDPDEVARQEQHLPKDAIPSRKDCPDIKCEPCPECPMCPECPSCPKGFKHPDNRAGASQLPPVKHGKVVCNSMDSNCPFCPACSCPECLNECPPCIKRPPNDPPTVVLGTDGEPHATGGTPVNPLVQSINDDLAMQSLNG
ncbi:unnamed protein product [Durusdinium trenchii]|uniref:Uncharacterized protein n=1 Tax=Durusdinium trenchii TaxID=1381693 RepID=A0ABP0JRH5_9DINO